jgi:hypothetical protein
MQNFIVPGRLVTKNDGVKVGGGDGTIILIAVIVKKTHHLNTKKGCPP